MAASETHIAANPADHFPLPSWFAEVTPHQGLALAQGCSRRQLRAAAKQLFARFEQDKRLELLPYGSHRRVFAGSRIVYKTPNPDSHNRHSILESIWANLYEAGDASYDYRGPITPCRLVWHESGMPVVVMERLGLTPAPADATSPEWCLEVENQQYAWSRILEAWTIYDASCVPGWTLRVETPEWWQCTRLQLHQRLAQAALALRR